jgi:hypothetical protein
MKLNQKGGMLMNASACSQLLNETHPINDHRGNPTFDAMLQQSYANEQIPPRNPVGAHIPDEDAFETFIGGSGI